MISTPISVKELLDNLGMSVEFENGWRVKSVTENGVAQKTGIKTGDIITALGDREIDAKTSFNGVGSITSVTVNRDGKRVPLKLVLR
jgi:S1-C subfamily serine protease